MNDTRRKYLKQLTSEFRALNTPEIEQAVSVLTTYAADLQDIAERLETERDEEQESFESMPESLQQTERGQASEQAISEMDAALAELQQLIELFEINTDGAANMIDIIDNNLEEAQSN